MRTNSQIAKQLKRAIRCNQLVPDAISARDRGRVYLRCTFEERAEVKARGAKWDPLVRKWYADSSVDINPLAKWIPRHG